MISRRAPRSAKPAEQLQQLSLNNSLGIDATKAPTDVRSALSMKNFVVNLDGSLSLRKPVILKNNFGGNVVKTIPLKSDSNTSSFLVVGAWNGVDGFVLVNENLQSTPYTLVWYDVSDTRRILQVPSNTVFPKNILDLSNATPTHTDSTVVLGNCTLDLTTTTFPGMPESDSPDLCNPTLYDELKTVPRMVQVYFSNEFNAWVVQIVSPAANVYSATDSKTSHPADTLLDNPYSVRDSYAANVTSVKTIRNYILSVEQSDKVIPVSGTNISRTHKNTAKVKVSAAQSYGEVTSAVDGQSTNSRYISNRTSTVYTSTENFHGIEVTHTVSLEYTFYINAQRIYTQTGPNPSWYVNPIAGVHEPARLHYTRVVKNVALNSSRVEVHLPKQTCNFKLSLCLGNSYVDWNASGRPWYSNITIESRSVYNLAPGESFSDTAYADLYTPFTRRINQLNDSETLSWVQGICNDYPNKGASMQCFSLDFDTSVAMNTVYSATSTSTFPKTVAQLTESNKTERYRATYATKRGNVGFSQAVLKAFCNLPTSLQSDAIYCSWRYSSDGITWFDALTVDSDTGKLNLGAYANASVPLVTVSEVSYKPVAGVEVSKDFEPTDTFRFRRLLATAPDDSVVSRADCLMLESSDNTNLWNAPAYRFKVCKLSEDNKILATYADVTYYPVYASDTKFENSTIENTAIGVKEYSQTRLYSFGHPSFKSDVFYSYPNELTLPYKNAISVAATSGTVVAVKPWRNYLSIFSTSAVYLSSKSEDGFLTKAVNTSIGVPEFDAKCVVPALNGIVFKSGNKVYQLYPNVYAGDDTVMNVTDVSQGVAHVLEAYVPNDNVSPFAFATSFEYVLMLPQEASTLCLRYDFNNRRWTSHEYAAVFDSFYMYSLDNICMYGTNTFGEYCEFMFDSGYEKLPFPDTFARANELRYGDVLKHASAIAEGAYGTTVANTVQDLQAQFNSTYVDTISPIEFELDTGQKTDTILTTKQFVETKLVVSTNTKYDKFPMQLVVHVDGDPNIITRDVSTDSAFWKDGSTFGMLNTTFNTLSDTSDISGTLRQLVVRYSGKGKSIRHILTGSSFCNFKLYETYVRYKHPNVKQ